MRETSRLHFLTQGPVKRKLLHKLGSGRRKKSFDVETAGEGEDPALLGNGSGVGGRVQDIAFSPADFATVETDLGGGGGGKRRMNLYQKHRSKSRYESRTVVMNHTVVIMRRKIKLPYSHWSKLQISRKHIRPDIQRSDEDAGQHSRGRGVPLLRRRESGRGRGGRGQESVLRRPRDRRGGRRGHRAGCRGPRGG